MKIRVGLFNKEKGILEQGEKTRISKKREEWKKKCNFINNHGDCMLAYNGQEYYPCPFEECVFMKIKEKLEEK